jgi:hypothetical protein
MATVRMIIKANVLQCSWWRWLVINIMVVQLKRGDKVWSVPIERATQPQISTDISSVYYNKNYADLNEAKLR